MWAGASVPRRKGGMVPQIRQAVFEDERGTTVLRYDISPRFQRDTIESNPYQPVVKVPASTEAGDAPGWQGAKSENIGNI